MNRLYNFFYRSLAGILLHMFDFRLVWSFSCNDENLLNLNAEESCLTIEWTQYPPRFSMTPIPLMIKCKLRRTCCSIRVSRDLLSKLDGSFSDKRSAYLTKKKKNCRRSQIRWALSIRQKHFDKILAFSFPSK